MKFLFNSADVYLRQSDWRDLALIKFCAACRHGRRRARISFGRAGKRRRGAVTERRSAAEAEGCYSIAAIHPGQVATTSAPTTGQELRA